MIASVGSDAVGLLVAVGGLALILYAVTGRHVTVREIGLASPVDDPDGLSRNARFLIAAVVGVALLATGIVLVA